MTLVRRTNNFFPSVFDDFFGRDWLGTEADLVSSNKLPAVNIKETDGSFEIELFTPGLNKKDFIVDVEDQSLIVSYENQKQKGDSDQIINYRRREFRQSSFKRSFSLPKTVATDKIEAKYKDGILTLNIPKKEENKQKLIRQIAIS